VAPARPTPATRSPGGADDSNTPASPCIRQCCLDDADECLGCGRMLEEIKAWHGADAAGRAGILDAAAARREARARRFPGGR
jgi:predicted Fe-S protein YdhL (DUF1289 family)